MHDVHDVDVVRFEGFVLVVRFEGFVLVVRVVVIENEVKRVRPSAR